jgi:carboxymethylenebutenolidase
MGSFKVIRDNPPLPVYFSKPEGDGPFPVVILFMHRPGMDKPQQIVCDDLAKAGYYVAGTDAYRDGELNQDTYTDETIFEDFKYVLDYIKHLDETNNEKIGTIGFCMGGRHAYLAAARFSEIKATVSYYGFPTRGNDASDTPIDMVTEFHSPVLGIFGETDPMISMVDVNNFKDVLLAASDKHRVEIYENVGHGFLNPDSPRHQPEAAAKAWLKTLEHFRKFL